jgi:hypothetical protein
MKALTPMSCEDAMEKEAEKSILVDPTFCAKWCVRRCLCRRPL